MKRRGGGGRGVVSECFICVIAVAASELIDLLGLSVLLLCQPYSSQKKEIFLPSDTIMVKMETVEIHK